VQLGLSHRAFQPEQKSVIKIGGIVTTIFINDKSFGERTQLQEAMPVQVRAREPGSFQGKHRTHLSHGDIRHQGLEVLPSCHLRSRLAQVAVEGAD
jgi:hypothetical protein